MLIYEVKRPPRSLGKEPCWGLRAATSSIGPHIRFRATFPLISNSLILGCHCNKRNAVKITLLMLKFSVVILTMSNSVLSPPGPSKCSSLSQLTVSLLAAGFGIFLEALKKSLYSFIDFDRSKKCSNVILGRPSSSFNLRRRPEEADDEELAAELAPRIRMVVKFLLKDT